MWIIYGIENCTSVRRTIKCLKEYKIEWRLFDFKKEQLDETLLRSWQAQFGDKLINKSSSTYRMHKEEVLHALSLDLDAQLELLKKYPLLIKRPIVEINGKARWIGWQEGAIEAYLEQEKKNKN